jgi:hypothetical protein
VSAQRLADLAAFPLAEAEAASVLGPPLSLEQLLDRLQMSCRICCVFGPCRIEDACGRL